jgi:hypothetical protein
VAGLVYNQQATNLSSHLFQWLSRQTNIPTVPNALYTSSTFLLLCPHHAASVAQVRSNQRFWSKEASSDDSLMEALQDSSLAA